jgi:hypothetical protein
MVDIKMCAVGCTWAMGRVLGGIAARNLLLPMEFKGGCNSSDVAGIWPFAAFLPQCIRATL